MAQRNKGLKQKIESKIEELEQDIIELREQTKPVSPDDAYGRISRMEAINNKAVLENSLRMSEAKLKRLQSALSRIDEPDFGICLSCRKPIAEQRMMFMPGSVYCMNCSR